MSKTMHIFENPLDNSQIEVLNSMFGDKSNYEVNMKNIWKLRSLLYAELEKPGPKNPEVSECFHTLNKLVAALYPTQGTYHPCDGLKVWKQG